MSSSEVGQPTTAMTWPGESLHSLHGHSLVVSDGVVGQPATAGDLVSPSVTDDLVTW